MKRKEKFCKSSFARGYEFYAGEYAFLVYGFKRASPAFDGIHRSQGSLKHDFARVDRD